MSQEHWILVVEDESDGAAVIDWMLKTQKFKTTVVADAEAALEEISHGQANFSAIMIDLALPGMDGFQLLEHVKSQTGAVLPTIAMTAFHTPELREKALSAGFDAYVPKPIDKAMLVKALSTVLN